MVDRTGAVDLADPLYGWDGGESGRMNLYEGEGHADDDGEEDERGGWPLTRLATVTSLTMAGRPRFGRLSRVMVGWVGWVGCVDAWYCN